MSNAISAMGVKLEMGDGAVSETFIEIAEVRNISGIGASLDEQDVTPHSLTNIWHQVIPTLLKQKQIKFEINYVPTEATHKNAAGGLLYAMVNRIKKNWKLIFPDSGSTTWTFSAYVIDFDASAPVDNALTASVTLSPTGAMTLA